MTTARDVRALFLDYFHQAGHEVVASSALVPANDPTLMFVNAGMVQFKDLFTGRETRAYKRAASSQKCIRISGKHNDLENVGRTARHHTFFEMLGNFSFGDYFKEEAIVRAWELIKQLGVPADRLVFTYFRGEDGIPADTEAANLWKKVTGFGDDRVIGMGKDDNFWSMGDTGPCGPCSEIHYFQGATGPVDPATFGQEPAPDGTGWMEIWNLVFMQFERFADGKMVDLPAPSVDTGMGLERITSVVQGVTSNYDTDLLQELVQEAARISGKTYGRSMSPDDVSMRVIADHARTAAFLIAEGIFPDRSNREYVLRRVMRRAVRHGHRLGIQKPFLHQVAAKVVDLMGDTYPELRTRKETLLNVTEQEEVRFRETIDRGLDLLAKNTTWRQEEGRKILPGDLAFKLYDTYGFPLDLTEVIGEESGFAVDQAGYDAALTEAKRRSEGSKVGEAAVGDIYKNLAGELAPAVFQGYETELSQSDVSALLHNGVVVPELTAGQRGEVLVLATPFYGESGGQVGDDGLILAPGVTFRVTDTQKPFAGLIVHKGVLEQGVLKTGDSVQLAVRHESRAATRRNHSATHLLHYALRTVLGEHVQQKGSMVGPERLRFDYAHGKTLSHEELIKVEDLVNTMILDNVEVKTEVLPIDQARAQGAMAIFEEKYGDVVRVLSMRTSHHASVELCGGTHASRTGDIGSLRVLSDRAIAAGVRRIEAITGWNVLEESRRTERSLAPVMKALSADMTSLQSKVEKLVESEKSLTKKLAEAEKKLAMMGTSGGGKSGIEAMLENARKFDGFSALTVRADLADPAALRELAESLRDKLGSAVVLVGSGHGGKAALVLTVSKALTTRFKAGELIRSIAQVVGGSGGGRPDMAQAGGTDPAKLDQALAELYGKLA